MDGRIAFPFVVDAEEIYRLISTASVLFYFLYHSQKTKFPVDIDAIKQFVSRARAELEGVSEIDLHVSMESSRCFRFQLKMILSCKHISIKAN